MGKDSKCPECGTPFDQVPFSVCKTHDKLTEWNGPTMTKSVPEALRKAADLYEERNKLYGDNYKSFGKLVDVLFPNGFPSGAQESHVSYQNRVGVLIQILSKLTRYCANFGDGGHSDSLHDLAVYAMMLDELDAELVERTR
jgi:hypothetical protein